MKDRSRMADRVGRQAGYGRGVRPQICVNGRVEIWLFGTDGKLKQHGVSHNLVTDKGDAYFAQLAYGNKATYSYMKLGTATTAPSKTYNNAGGYIGAGDYISGSAKACDASSPKVGASPNILHYERTWAAGEGTNATINRVSLVNENDDAGSTDGTNTYAIALLPDRPINKGASDTLKITWDITFLGA